MTPILHIANLSHRYRSKHGVVAALSEVNITLDSHGITAVAGPNGSGKSTLFSLVTGLQQVQEGELRFSRSGLRIAAVFQAPSLDRELTVFENFWHYAMLFGVNLRRDALPVSLLEAFHLEEYLDRPVKELSGGFQRRTEIAKVLCISPDLLVMDEPFTGLDAASREAIFEELSLYSERLGLPVLMITHALDLASRCAKVIVMEKGSVLADCTPAELLAEFGQSVVEIETDDAIRLAEFLAQVFDPQRVCRTGRSVLLLNTSLEDALPHLDAHARAGSHIQGRRPTLEDYMLLRDGILHHSEHIGVAA